MKVHLITAGPAGTAIGERLAPLLQAAGDQTSLSVITPETRIESSHWPHADLRIVATWREDAELFDIVDRSAFETRTPYLPIVIEHPRLRVGPTIVPGGSGGPANTIGGCNDCFTGRQRQHNPGIDRAAALWERYANDRAAGPEGYLSQHVSAAAALAARVIRAAREGLLHDERNVVRTLHLLQGALQQHELIPVHGCTRCGTPRPDSTWADLAQELAHLAPELEGAAHRG